MKATLEANEAIIKEALLLYFAKHQPTKDKVVLKASDSEDYFGHRLGHTISATVEIEVGDPYGV
jgi:hypothetical protein